MGKVLVTARLENLADLYDAQKGAISNEKVRRVEAQDALVDTGATGLLVPTRIVRELGLRPYRTRVARGIGGVVQIPIHEAVRLTIQDRDCTVDVGEIGDEFPIIIGQVPLEMLDWVVDLQGQKLIGNPAHGGEFMMDAYALGRPREAIAGIATRGESA